MQMLMKGTYESLLGGAYVNFAGRGYICLFADGGTYVGSVGSEYVKMLQVPMLIFQRSAYLDLVGYGPYVGWLRVGYLGVPGTGCVCFPKVAYVCFSRRRWCLCRLLRYGHVGVLVFAYVCFPEAVYVILKGKMDTETPRKT